MSRRILFCRVTSFSLLIFIIFVVTRMWHSNHLATNHAYSDETNWKHSNSNNKHVQYQSKIQAQSGLRKKEVGESSQLKHLHEQESVVKNVEFCLLTVNITKNFTTASDNARRLVQVLREIIPRDFDQHYTSPCWEADFNVSVNINGISVIAQLNHHLYRTDLRDQNPLLIRKLQYLRGGSTSSPLICLPKVFLAGFPKCGSTFLYCLMTHMFGSSQLQKEPNWWIAKRPETHPRKTESRHVPIYLLNFLDMSHELSSGHYNHTMYHQPLTIDGCPNLMEQWPRWYKDEPPINYCLLPAIIPQVLPDSKFVVVMRSPLDMLYSTFWYSCTRLHINLSRQTQIRGPSIFHEKAATKIAMFNTCMLNRSLHECIIEINHDLFSPELPATCGRLRLGKALYIAHVQRWLSVVPRDKFLFLTLEELERETGSVQRELWRFVGYPDAAYDISTDGSRLCGKNIQHKIDYHNDPQLRMMDDTRKMLTHFFKPYNKMLVDLLNDTKFLWDH